MCCFSHSGPRHDNRIYTPLVRRLAATRLLGLPHAPHPMRGLKVLQGGGDTGRILETCPAFAVDVANRENRLNSGYTESLQEFLSKQGCCSRRDRHGEVYALRMALQVFTPLNRKPYVLGRHCREAVAL